MTRRKFGPNFRKIWQPQSSFFSAAPPTAAARANRHKKGPIDGGTELQPRQGGPRLGRNPERSKRTETKTRTGKRTKIQAGRMEEGSERRTGASEDRGSCRGPLPLVTICIPPYAPRPRPPSQSFPRRHRLIGFGSRVFSPWGLGFLNG